MHSFTTFSALMRCNKGSAPAALQITSQSFEKIEGLLQATEKDKQSMTNIVPFGICSITRKACKPAPIQWENTSVFTIENNHELTDESYCPCSIGGIIKFLKPGQSGFVKMG